MTKMAHGSCNHAFLHDAKQSFKPKNREVKSFSLHAEAEVWGYTLHQIHATGCLCYE